MEAQMKKFTLLLLIISILTLWGCTQNISPNTYANTEIGVVGRVDKGVILSKRSVIIDNNSHVGGIAGATAGGTAGAMLGSSVGTGIIGAVGGAVVGGVLGNAADKSLNQHRGYEYIIKLRNGPTVATVQAKDLNLNVHQHVLIIYGAMTRIVPDENAHA